MSFLSVQFIILIIAVLVLLQFIKSDVPGRLVLLAASYLFYACFSLQALILLILLSVFTWGSGAFVLRFLASDQREKARLLCIGSVSLQVIVLLFFKFSGLFPMPVGLSFYMLQAISYIADLYLGRLQMTPKLLDTLVYIGFFPQIVSGPIVKAKDFIPQLYERRALTKERLSYAVQMFALGAFMKLVLADRLAVCVDKVYAAPLAYSGLSLFITSIGYTLQLFFDFAGYSGIAIAVGWALGFDLGQNFNLPYMASNPADFWRRWHISLSTWLRDYVYIPLGGNRKGKTRTYINILLTMLVSGLWHGSTVNFLIWGALHGAGQAAHRMLRGDNKREQKVTGQIQQERGSSLRRIAAMVLNFLFVSFLWIPFRAETWGDAWTILSRIFTLQSGIAYYYVYVFIFGALLLVVQILAGRFNNGNDPFKPLPLDRLYGKVIFCVLLLAIAMFAYFGNGAFIYAHF